MRNLRVSLAQIAPKLGDKAANLTLHAERYDLPEDSLEESPGGRQRAGS